MAGARVEFRGDSSPRRSRDGRRKNHCVRRAGGFYKNRSGISRAEPGTKVSASVARDGCIVVMQRIAPARSRGTDSSGSRAERAQPMKKDEKRSFPRPRGGQDAFRGKAFGGSAVFPRQVLRQGEGSRRPFAERVARLWAPPAPSRRASRGSAGGGFPGFADSTTWDRSAPASEYPAENVDFGNFLCREQYPVFRTKNPSFPTRAGVIQSFFKKQSARVYPRNCCRTIPNIRTRFCNTSGICRILYSPPRPSYPVGAGRYPLPGELRSPAPREPRISDSV